MRGVARHALRFGIAGKVRELPVPSDSTAADDGLLVSRALGGDRWAEEALYRAHVRAIARIVTRLLARSHEAEDVVQETFFLAFTRLKDLRHADSFRAWLIQIAIRLVRRRFRRRRLLRALGLDRQQDDARLLSEVDPAASPEARAEIAKLDDVLSALPSGDRIAWILRHVEGHRLEEVAAACRCSLATAKRRILRAQRCIDAHIAFDAEDHA